jgi:electron transfer flavoprotein beta subunit
MIGVCLKWVDRRPEFDPVGVPLSPDARFAGVSAADQAALEWALRCRDTWADTTEHDVVAVTVGPPEADAILRDALVAGATRAIRIDLPFDTPSRVTAACLAIHLGSASLVWCGDYSLDRGTGSVPAFLAAELGFAQALGLIDIGLQSPGVLTVLRRLDRGRRERLAIEGPTVVSVEGSTALLRRAPLRALLAKQHIETVAGPRENRAEGVEAPARPYRPRPRVLPAPTGATALDRVRSITAANHSIAHGETVVLDPAAAADRILEVLQVWGYRTN